MENEKKKLLEELIHETKAYYFGLGFIFGVIVALLFCFIIFVI